MKKQRLIVGLTGSFGSGKSTVGKILKRNGCVVIDSDQLAHEVFKPNHPIAGRIRKLFNVSTVDKKAIAKQVFQNSEKRKKLEALIHPYVFKRIRSKVKKVKKGVVVLEIPLLFETGFDKFCDITISVFTPEHKIISRLKQKGFKSGEVRSRLASQLSGVEKRKRSDLYIENLGSEKVLVQKVKSVLKHLKSK